MPRNQVETKRLKEQKKNNILSSALYIFAFKGYAGTTIDDISKNANIKRSLFYHYFKDKADVFLTLIDKTTLTVTKLFSSVDMKKNSLELLDDVINIFIDILTNEKESLSCIIYMLLNIYYERDYIPKPQIDLSSRINLFSLINNIVKKGIEEKKFIECNEKELTISFLSMMKGFAFNRIVVGKEKFICPNIEIIKNLFLRKESAL